MRVAVVVFPGSNCDRDCHWALNNIAGISAELVWHAARGLGGFDAVVLPGGFSYGDYLRAGAIARYAPVMGEVAAFARRGGPVLGICNGFQILLEAGLLPGAMLKNRTLTFRCRPSFVRVESAGTPFTASLEEGRVLSVPIAHAEGNYFAEPDVLARLEDEGRVVFRYCDRNGRATAEANPNGSAHNIAGIAGELGNVVGMMPHPERASDALLGSTDGLEIFQSLLAWWTGLGKQSAAAAGGQA